MTTTRTSSGLLCYRVTAAGELEVLIGHMGGPIWARRNERGWSLPKGEVEEGEDPIAAARREFSEETGFVAPERDYVELGSVMQANRKRVIAFAACADFDADKAESNLFEMEWPPGSGTVQSYPEMDHFSWVSPDRARMLLVAAQAVLVSRLEEALSDRS